MPRLTRACLCHRQLWLFVWSQYQRSKKYNFPMCPLTAEPSCLVLGSCVCECVWTSPCSHFMFDLPLFLTFPFPLSCRYFILSARMCTHTLQHGGVNSRDLTISFDQISSPSSVWWLFVWHCPTHSVVAGVPLRLSASYMSGQWRMQVCKEQSLS